MTNASPTQLHNQPEAPPSVFCVIVNWNGWEDTAACLHSLTLQDYSALQILVVDNGSADDSCQKICATFPNVTLLDAGGNLGFAGGSNVGIRHAISSGADYIWLLNNDTTAPPDTCSKLVARAKAQHDAGIIGSVLYYMDRPTEVQAWGGGEINVLLGRTKHLYAPFALGAHSYLTFASVLIPSHVIKSVGILYEGFFMYFDDSDYCLRVTAAGYKLTVAEDTAILHRVGGSATHRSPTIDRYATCAGLHFLRRHSPLPLLSMALFLAPRLLSRALRGHWKNVGAVLAGVGVYSKERSRTFRESL